MTFLKKNNNSQEQLEEEFDSSLEKNMGLIKIMANGGQGGSTSLCGSGGNVSVQLFVPKLFYKKYLKLNKI